MRRLPRTTIASASCEPGVGNVRHAYIRIVPASLGQRLTAPSYERHHVRTASATMMRGLRIALIGGGDANFASSGVEKSLVVESISVSKERWMILREPIRAILDG